MIGTKETEKLIYIPAELYIQKDIYPVYRIENDDGNASRRVPTCQFFMACEPNGTEMHSWRWTASRKSILAHEGIDHASNILLNTSLLCIRNPKIVHKAKKELFNRLNG